MCSKVWRQEWVVHCEAVGAGLGALKYLAPYVFRVALSNNRLVKLEHDRVTFRYRDTDTGAERLCTLDAEDFIHRFLQHVLPKGFVKVRYYGLFSPSWRRTLSALQQQLKNRIEIVPTAQNLQRTETSTSSLPELRRCPNCGGVMLPVLMLSPFAQRLSPPPLAICVQPIESISF
jgi:hypothetical protein